MTLIRLNTLRYISKSVKVIFLFIIATHMCSTISYAAHPLVSDDTGTQGKGKFLFELNGQAGYGREMSMDDTGAYVTKKDKESEIKAAVTYGVIENIDVILGIPY